ncbi:MAG: CBS domain-containing protein [Deltaproteobacteria bacterium]
MSQKARPVYTLSSDQSVDDAVSLMSAKKVSALLVTEADQPVGIFSERDVFRAHIKDKTAAFCEIPLKDAISHKLFSAKAEDEISSVMSIMIQADIKHMPVVKENKIIGILTLNDLIQNQLDMLTDELHHLREYIEALHHAGQD